MNYSRNNRLHRPRPILLRPMGPRPLHHAIVAPTGCSRAVRRVRVHDPRADHTSRRRGGAGSRPEKVADEGVRDGGCALVLFAGGRLVHSFSSQSTLG